MCALATILFLGGWLPPVAVVPFTWVPGIIWFILKAGFVFFMFAMVKAFVPRYRYDQLILSTNHTVHGNGANQSTRTLP